MIYNTNYLQARWSATKRRLAEKWMLAMKELVAQSMVLKILPFLETPVTTLQRITQRTAGTTFARGRA